MDVPERDPESHPSGDAGATKTEREEPISVQDAAPRSSTVLPFSRRNYSYSPCSAKRENDIVLPRENGDDLGPGAA